MGLFEEGGGGGQDLEKDYQLRVFTKTLEAEGMIRAETSEVVPKEGL